MSGESFFDIDGDAYLGRDPARGPWSADHCHAGPVAGAIARAIEVAIGSERPLTRLTIELIRPVPVAGFRVAVTVTRSSRRLATARAELTGLDGKLAATAAAMAIAPAPETAIEAGPGERPVLAEARPGPFPIRKALHDRPFFGQFTETRYPPGEDDRPGPTALWLRTPALVTGETPSSFQRLCPLADCGNAIGRNAETDAFTFLNTDLTIHAHRQSASDWLMSRAQTHWHSDGIGLSQAVLCDAEGPVATALQSLIVARQN